MTYAFQTFTALQVLTAAQMTSLMESVRDHEHGTDSGVNATMGTISVKDLKSAQRALTAYLLPSASDGWRGIYRAGFDWWSRNQQWGGPWGGELLDAATGTLHRTEFVTGYVPDALADGGWTTGQGASQTYRAQGFKVPESVSLSAVWLPLSKVGNPTNNLGVFIYPDDGSGTKPTGSTPITNGTATAQSGKLVAAAKGWYRFVFATPPSLTGGTKYWIVAKSSGAVDGSNYWYWSATGSGSGYPYGTGAYADATPTWSATASETGNFLIELSSTTQILQSGGQFDGKLQFGGSGASGALTMSRGLCSTVPLHELLDLREFTLRIVGASLTKDATILDIGYGMDHDRIVLRVNVTTGYAQLDVYESDGTKHTVTATSVDCSSGTVDLGIHVRAKADGADRLDLYVNGAANGTPITSATITFDEQFRNLGTMWVGGGFALAPTWSGSSIGINGFSALPSTLGWTYSGTATEANAFSVSGGRLYQNKNGYASTDTGLNTKSSAGLSNTNGWAVRPIFQITSGVDGTNTGAHRFDVSDGAKFHVFAPRSYWTERYDGSWVIGPQIDYKSNKIDALVVGKGSDVLTFVNHRLIDDGTGLMTSATATNSIVFGDQDSGAGNNADVVYSAMSYYNTDWLPPQFTSGSISELAIWSGDRTAILANLYNSGTHLSVKQYCNLELNYVDKSGKRTGISQLGITNNPSTTSTGAVTAPEMEGFIVGDCIDITADDNMSHSTTGSTAYGVVAIYVDGAQQALRAMVAQAAANDSTVGVRVRYAGNLGLHKVERRWFTGTGTLTGISIRRSLHALGKV